MRPVGCACRALLEGHGSFTDLAEALGDYEGVRADEDPQRMNVTGW